METSFEKDPKRRGGLPQSFYEKMKQIVVLIEPRLNNRMKAGEEEVEAGEEEVEVGVEEEVAAGVVEVRQNSFRSYIE